MGMHQYEVQLIVTAWGIFHLACAEKNGYLEYIGFENCVMAELGNQRIRYLENYWDRVPWPGIEGGLLKGSSKYYYTSLGVKHDAFDLNGGDGAVALDLIKPIDKKYIGKYNIVTNFGTSEHCGVRDEQYLVFNNIDKFCCHGGVMVHNVPHTGNWPGHAHVWYTTNFFKELAKIYKYHICVLGVQRRRGPITPEDYKNALKDQFGNLSYDESLKDKAYAAANGYLKDMVTCILVKREKNVSVSKSDFSKPYGCESYLMDF